jgi:hypothetical protein
MLLTMPITSPFQLNMGLPEFPPLIAASVWKNSHADADMLMRRCFGVARPLTWPTVRVRARP